MADSPNQLLDENLLASGFYTLDDGPQAVEGASASAQSTVFSTTCPTCILIAADSEFFYEIGTDPTAVNKTGTPTHWMPAVPCLLPLYIPAGDKIAILGADVIISVVA